MQSAFAFCRRCFGFLFRIHTGDSMSLGHEISRGWATAGTETISRTGVSLGAVSFGLASVAMATGAGAQEAAEPATPLPPLEVTAKKKATKQAAKKAKQQPTSPAPVAYEDVPAAAEAPQDATTAFTPASGNTLQSGTGLGRLPGSLQDMPQTVSVVSQQRIKEQKITTVEDALRTVPGITVSSGEGNGGMNGDQFRIRGFQSRGDVYVDGLRDFGVYVRDSFAFEEVQVIKGASSESFGMGTTGGAINIRQKTAHLGDSTTIEGTIGTGPLYRSTIDVNKQINATTAARAVAMYHDQDIQDRDHVYSDRWGFLGSLGFGLGTDETLTLNYIHQDGERRPDMGIPIANNAARSGTGWVGVPVTEEGASRKNYYGKETDLDDHSVDMITARYSKKINDWLTLSNDSRVAWYDRYFAQTVGQCTSAACVNAVASGNLDVTHEFGGPAGFSQESWGAQNITTLLAKFSTGGLRHELVTGVDLFLQQDYRNQLQQSPAKTPGTIADPNFNYDGTVSKNPLQFRKSDADNVGLFVSDRVWLTEEFSILGGVRWDQYRAHFQSTNTGSWATAATDAQTETREFSPKASVIWEPLKDQTYYASWAQSFSPVGQDVASAPNPIGSGVTDSEPEENELWEVGTKIGLLDNRLGLTAALFQIDKLNAYQAVDGGLLAPTGEKQRVRGFEIGLSGQITDLWIVQAGYTYLDSEIRKGGNKGNQVALVPENSFSIWTTYDVSDLFQTPGKLLVGGGVTYVDEYFVASVNKSIVPEYVSLDAVVSYEIDGYGIALNGYNLTDELNYTAGQGSNGTPEAGRAVLGPGRAATLTISKRF